MKIVYLGHSSFLVEVEGGKLLFDPFISPNPLAKSIDVKSIKPDFILVSHGHEDHIADVDAIAKQSGATIVSNFEIISWFEKKGCTKVHPMNIGGAWNFPFGKLKYVQAVHSSTMPDGASGGNPGGFIIDTSEGSFYYAGDTALFSDMKLMCENHNIKFAFLPIGNNFTMGADDAVKAAEFIKTKQVVAMHYDTFGYIKIDHEAVKNKFHVAGIDLKMPKIGETLTL